MKIGLNKYFKLLFYILGFSTTVLIVFLVLQSSEFRLSKITIELESESNQNFLFEKIKEDLFVELNQIVGVPLWKLSLEDTLMLIESDVRVQKASLNRSFPNGINIKITPREPMLLFVYRNGKTRPVASDGSFLPIIPIEEAPDIPHIRGSKFFSSQEDRLKAIQLLKTLESFRNISPKKISEIDLKKNEGLVISILGTNTQIVFGDSDFETKASRVERVLNYLLDRDIKDRVIDARFSKKVVVRLRNQN